MEQNKRDEHKPDRSALGKAKDAHKTIEELEASRANRLKAQKQKQQMIIIAAALVAVIVLVAVLIIVLGGKDDTTKVNTADLGSEDTGSISVNIPGGFLGDDTPVPGPAGTAPTNTSAPKLYTAEEYLAELAGGATPQVYDMLPVYTKVAGSGKRIAITIDELTNAENLNNIITLAESSGAKLTLFPTGSAVDASSDLQAALRRAHTLHFEIENHTYDNVNLYSLTDEEMAYQIYMTQVAVNNALHYDYEMHFLRTAGARDSGRGEHDPRTHQYLNQLGTYKGIASWEYYGAKAQYKNLQNNLKDGYIYVFHCTGEDVSKLRDFIPYAKAQGYEIVTLNELTGYEENAFTALEGSVDDSAIPAPLPYVYEPSILLGGKEYKQLYAVQILQRRLVELGYLSTTASADGDYGPTTELAVRLFQYYNNLKADGYAGKDTQMLLFSSEAKPNPSTYIAGEPDTYPPEGERDLFQ